MKCKSVIVHCTGPWVDNSAFITGTIKFEQAQEPSSQMEDESCHGSFNRGQDYGGSSQEPPNQMPVQQPQGFASYVQNRGQGGSSKRAGLGYDTGSNRGQTYDGGFNRGQLPQGDLRARLDQRRAEGRSRPQQSRRQFILVRNGFGEGTEHVAHIIQNSASFSKVPFSYTNSQNGSEYECNLRIGHDAQFTGKGQFVLKIF